MVEVIWMGWCDCCWDERGLWFPQAVQRDTWLDTSFISLRKNHRIWIRIKPFFPSLSHWFPWLFKEVRLCQRKGGSHLESRRGHWLRMSFKSKICSWVICQDGRNQQNCSGRSLRQLAWNSPKNETLKIASSAVSWTYEQTDSESGIYVVLIYLMIKTLSQFKTWGLLLQQHLRNDLQKLGSPSKTCYLAIFSENDWLKSCAKLARWLNGSAIPKWTTGWARSRSA